MGRSGTHLAGLLLQFISDHLLLLSLQHSYREYFQLQLLGNKLDALLHTRKSYSWWITKYFILRLRNMACVALICLNVTLQNVVLVGQYFAEKLSDSEDLENSQELFSIMKTNWSNSKWLWQQSKWNRQYSYYRNVKIPSIRSTFRSTIGWWSMIIAKNKRLVCIFSSVYFYPFVRYVKSIYWQK